MLLANVQLVSFFDDQVSLEDHVQRKENTTIRQQSNIAKLKSSDPFENSSVFVYNFSLLEVELAAGTLRWHFNEGLISEYGMVKIFFESEKSLEGSSEKFRMAQSISNPLVFLFWFDGNIVFVAFSVIVVTSDGSVESFLFPLNDVLECVVGVEGSVGDESILVIESPDSLVHDISALETDVGKFLFGGTILTEISVNTRDSIFIGSVKLCESIPYLSLHFEIILKVIDDGIVLFKFCLIVVLVEF